MLGKICYFKNDSKKEKYIVYDSYYGNEVLELVCISTNNQGKKVQIRSSEILLDEDSQKIIDNL